MGVEAEAKNLYEAAGLTVPTFRFRQQRQHRPLRKHSHASRSRAIDFHFARQRRDGIDRTLAEAQVNTISDKAGSQFQERFESSRHEGIVNL
jgi:hypothetical protein